MKSNRYHLALWLYWTGIFPVIYGALVSLSNYAQAVAWLLAGALVLAIAFLVKPMRLS